MQVSATSGHIAADDEGDDDDGEDGEDGEDDVDDGDNKLLSSVYLETENKSSLCALIHPQRGSANQRRPERDRH